MKKRFLAILLTLVMVLALLPTAAFAADTVTVELYESLQGGTRFISRIQVKEGEPFGDSLPTLPEKEGYVFHGWFAYTTQMSLMGSFEVPIQVDSNTIYLKSKYGTRLEGIWVVDNGTTQPEQPEEPEEIIGACGANLIWTLGANGTLTIRGTGKMEDYNVMPAAPWHNKNGKITAVVISDGVTSIGSFAFYYCVNLKSVTIPNSVTSIGGYAFGECTSLKDVCYSGTKAQWDAFPSYGDNDPLFKATIHCSDSDKPEQPEQPEQPTEEETGTPTVKLEGTDAILTSSKNINAQDYKSGRLWSDTVESYLYENSSGGLTRVEFTDNKMAVEDYNDEFQLQSCHVIPVELPIWGGFFAGKNYNFLIFGQNNEEENNSKEVIRVVKYSKDWDRLGSASLYGANTIKPFDFGSLRCAEYNGYLYIRTCHVMYTSSDGLNHQANVMINVRQNDMKITDSFYLVESGMGYVSHSFNQFILIDQNNRIVTLDHGDTYPRAIVMFCYNMKAGQDSFRGGNKSVNILQFPQSPDMYQNTGTAVGGFAETSSGYVTAYHFDGTANNDPRDVCLAFTNKNMSNTNTVKISSGMDTSAPVLAPTGLDGGYVMWNGCTRSGKYSTSYDNTLYYARYDANGQTGTVQTATASLSDCAPIVWNGKVVWYVTDSSAPTFYTLDSSGVTAHTANAGTSPTPTPTITFTDVPADEWYTDAVAWAVEEGITGGTSATTFSPVNPCTHAHILTFLWRAAGSPAPAGTVNGNEYYSAALQWAKEQGITSGTVTPDAPCLRADAVYYMWKYAKAPSSTTTLPFTDVTEDPAVASKYSAAVKWAMDQGVTSGTSATTFSPNGTCTRAEIVTFLHRGFAK